MNANCIYVQKFEGDNLKNDICMKWFIKSTEYEHKTETLKNAYVIKAQVGKY